MILQQHGGDSKLSWLHRLLLDICKHGGVPNHVAFIMDGNRRFVKQHKNLTSVVQGHSLGFESLMLMLEMCMELGVRVVTVYAFSEENFNRPREEVDGLMQLAREKFQRFLDFDGVVMKRGIVVNILGRMELLPIDVQAAAARVVLGTRRNKANATLNICFAYSGTEEIAGALRQVSSALLRGELIPSDVDCKLISQCTYLGLSCIAPPDLLIRTSGETRLSDFLLWHLSSTKLIFVDVLWPDLTIWDLLACVAEWQLGTTNTGNNSSSRNENLRIKCFLRRLQVQRLAYWQLLALNGNRHHKT